MFVPFTGLYHVGAREYDPRTARWLQRDPIGVAGGHPNVYLYCANDPVNGSDSDGTAEDPGGPKGSIRLVVTQFIMQEKVFAFGDCFSGDNRDFSPTKGGYRLQHQLIITKGAGGEPIVERRSQVGSTKKLRADGSVVFEKRASPRRFGTTKAKKLSSGGWEVRLGLAASNPFYGNVAPALGHDLTLEFGPDGNLRRFSGDHSIFPACEAYIFQGDKGKSIYKIFPVILHNPLSASQTGPSVGGLMHRTPFSVPIPSSLWGP